ncbi:amidohydrolase [Thermaurantimonas aggregans]|uniref:Omega-amidase YafV n=1 Tax=Thermaurantimonas aggregans TaxID=2173829 RepID=A0A401XI17_9FLAO|nr:amidohydrolase [Thermaurantimonas aggregans]MCX8149200.1 amidohydrolase [Thermaurantimonas aggregans]GCD76642.1 amidohydrolase [Thermaurantimonas aggregans]
MNELRINLLQYDILWHDVEGNHAKIQKLCEDMPQCHLLILPEMFNTGFSMEPHLFGNTAAEQGIELMRQLSETYQTSVVGSLITLDSGKYFNRLYFITPEGDEYSYDKKHLFSLAGEEKVYTPGKERILVEYLGWKICPLICYDLRFPVWSRQRPEEYYDLLLYVANWPQRRSHAWRSLLPARAIENMAYVAGVNRIGYDAKGVYHSGDSAVFDVLGQSLATASEGREEVISANLSKSNLSELRESLGFLRDADRFELH